MLKAGWACRVTAVLRTVKCVIVLCVTERHYRIKENVTTTFGPVAV